MKLLKVFILSLALLLVTVGASNHAPAFAPGKPSAVSPGNGGLTTDYTPELKWTNTAGIGGTYDVEIATDPGFGGFIIDSNYGFAGNTYTVGVVLNPAQTYFWHVQAYDSLSTPSGWSITFSFRTAVPPPTLVDPADMSVLQTNRPLFDWNSVPNASGYNLQVSRYSTFSSLLLNVSVSYTATQYKPTADLPANSTLFWRVRTLSSAYGPGAFSAYFTISQSALPPSTPVNVYPGDNKLNYDYTPRLVWKAVTIPSTTTFLNYEVQVTTDHTFADMDPLTIICLPPTCIDDTSVASQEIDTTAHTSWFDIPDPASALNPATTYYWRVRAYNTDLSNTYYGNWSTYFTIRTTVERVPSPPISPPDASDLLGNRPTFDWTPVTAAGSYQLQIATNTSFATPIISLAVHEPWTSTITLPANRTLYWHVRALNPNYGPGLWSDVWSMNTANPPSAPALKLPVNNSLFTNPSYMPTFLWSVSSLPLGTFFAYYEFQITKDGAFTNMDPLTIICTLPACADDTSASFQYAPTLPLGAPLDPLSKYFWRVRACNMDGECSGWSSVFILRTALTSPTLVTYGGGSFSNPFDWNDVTGATSYTIQVSRYANFSILVLNATTYLSQYTYGATFPNGSYYWRVRANNLNFGPSLWTAPDTFTVP
jgi:hypothetical protein